MARKFKKVPKTKRGVPKKYVRGAKSPSAQESEIIETRKLYAAGQLTPQSPLGVCQSAAAQAPPTSCAPNSSIPDMNMKQSNGC